MDSKARRFAEDSEECAAQGKFSYAIWLAENAIELSDAADVEEVATTTFRIAENDLRDAVTACELIIGRLEKLINNHAGLLPEEWALVISDLSTCYSIFRFLQRMPYCIATPNLDPIMTKLTSVTDDFSLRSFRCQLDAARARFPNPLPPPLGYDDIT